MFLGCFDPPKLNPKQFLKSLDRRGNSRKSVWASALFDKMMGMEPKPTKGKPIYCISLA